jgi:hypothetical protein
VARLLNLGQNYIGSHPGTAEGWPMGVERDVPPETAAYLLADFPGNFIACDLDPVDTAVHAPPVDREMKPPKRRVVR